MFLIVQIVQRPSSEHHPILSDDRARPIPRADLSRPHRKLEHGSLAFPPGMNGYLPPGGDQNPPPAGRPQVPFCGGCGGCGGIFQPTRARPRAILVLCANKRCQKHQKLDPSPQTSDQNTLRTLRTLRKTELFVDWRLLDPSSWIRAPTPLLSLPRH
jgi:hypothetical protein